ncbi:hypothetical protein [Brachyspira pilosicoli]|uniref:hypothetical protein n=1 Tax=Brachyspira pilosicoli TaxID=52584 RepID=UPI00266511FE|nr:hypothetical protein [Brachyspira pilosicoli]
MLTKKRAISMAPKHNDVDILVTMKDLADELQGRFPIVIGIESITNKEEIKSKISEALSK